MLHEQIFVGCTSIGIGLLAIGAAVFNWEFPYKLGKAQWVEARYGRSGARIFYALLGGGMTALGVWIAGRS